jgi:hypothetical protein
MVVIIVVLVVVQLYLARLKTGYERKI